jgi:outer membrane protein assembly factor BamB
MGVNVKGHKNLWSSPAILDGKAYFGSYDGNVYCLDAVTGREVWRFMEVDWVGSSPGLAPELGLLFIGPEFAVEGKRNELFAFTRTGSGSVPPAPPVAATTILLEK